MGVNWVVLQDRESGRELVVGGTHISYCKGGCDSVHECELREMYRKLEKMRKKYNAPVVWMGDMNRKMGSGSRSGKRAVNWVVLQDRESGRELVVGGTHISYCSKGCDSVHECELKEMYRKLEKMRKKYSAPVVWMGDMNRKMDSSIMRNVLKGKVSSMRTFSV